MADCLPSSPLSSPPESVINVALTSPVKKQDRIPSSSPHPEPAAEPVAEPAAEPVEVPADQPTASPKGNAEAQVEAQTSITQSPDDSAHLSAQKRKASMSRKPVSSKKPRRVLSAGKKSAQDKKWEAPFVYTDAKSPLANADLRAILLHPQAWDILTAEEKQDILAKFPDATNILGAGTPDARPDTVFLRNDDNFRHDCARYCENIETGQHDEEWLSQAWTAHEKHKRGDYDEFLREQFEEDWETKLPREDKDEDAKSDRSSATEAVESKQGSPASAGRAQEAPVAKRTSRPSSRPPQSAGEGGSPKNLHGEGAKQKAHNAAPTGNSEARQPISPASVGPVSPPTASQQQDESTTSTSAAQPG